MAYRIYIASLLLTLILVGSTVNAGEGKKFAVIGGAAASTRLVKAPGSQHALGRIPAGSTVEILEERQVKHGIFTVTYYRISYQGKEGWISQYATASPQPSPASPDHLTGNTPSP
jgi:hypothetical protein